MDRLKRLLEDESPLTPDDKQLIVNLIWLLERSDAHTRDDVVGRLQRLLDSDPPPEGEPLLTEIRAAIDELENRSRRGKGL